MVSMLVSSVVDHGFKPRSGQIKDYEISICCFSAKQSTVSRTKSKDWLARNQVNCPYSLFNWLFQVFNGPSKSLLRRDCVSWVMLFGTFMSFLSISSYKCLFLEYQFKAYSVVRGQGWLDINQIFFRHFTEVFKY
jgi:hypothetical protein